ncbi:unnamed protein product [Alternaria burnsii]|nr:unnamed protein product [Alternaria burnsii]
MTPPDFSPDPGSTTVSLETTSQITDAALLRRSPISIPMGDTLSEGMHGTDWSGLSHISGSGNRSNSELPTNFPSNGINYFNELSTDFNLPLAWMIPVNETSFQMPCTLESGISDSYISSYGNMVAIEPTNNDELPRSEVESHITVEAHRRVLDKTAGTVDSYLTSSCPPFPMLEENTLQIVGAEIFGHVSAISTKAYTDARSFYISERGHDDMLFPHSQMLHAFVELYFEYFDPYLPFLHPVRVERGDICGVLLIAVAAIGSQYSEAKDAPTYTTVLHYLLRKAIKVHIFTRRTEISFAQSVLLRDVGLLASGRKSDHAVLQRERNMITNLCRSLSTRAGAPDSEDFVVDQNLDHGWMPWLQGEEVVRLVHCVYTLECFQLILFDQRPLFRVTDFAQRLPCTHVVWKCRTEKSWNEQKRYKASDNQASRFDHFASNIRILSLYADERAILDQVRSSQRLSALLKPELATALQEQDVNSNRDSLLSSGVSPDEITYLDQRIEDAIASTHLSCHAGDHTMYDPVVHVISILRNIPLRMIYASVGWQANLAEMQKTRERLKEYLRRNPDTARICLWHAAQIYAFTRNDRHPAYYATLSFAIAVTYILLYDQILSQKNTSRDLVRLDKIKEKTDITAWARDGEGSRVHITGIGILHSTESSQRLLADAGNILRSQRPWRGISEDLVACFAQLSQGRMPRGM